MSKKFNVYTRTNTFYLFYLKSSGEKIALYVIEL